jgi:hypothetical protein
MSINLVSMAMQYLAPAIVERMAAAVGLDKGLIGKAISAAVPAILAGLVGKSSKPDGAASIAGMLGKLDPGMLGSLAGMIGGKGQADLVKDGTNMLSSMLGGNALSGLTGAVGKFAGIGEQQSSGLMGMLAPAVMGVLGREATKNKLDAGGIADLLSDQKQHISSAMPAGFADLLKGTGLTDAIGGNLRSVVGSAAGAASGAANSAGAAAGRVAQSTGAAAGATQQAARSSSMGWLPWAALAALIAAGWWWYTSPRAVKLTAPAVPKIMVGSVDVGSQAGSVLSDLTSVLGTVTNADSARAALPRLQAASATLDRVVDASGKLPADSKSSLAKYVSASLPAAIPLIAKVLGIPGVDGILRAVLEPMRAKLEALAKG